MANQLGNNSYFNPKLGAVGAIIMGGAVYFANKDYGFDIAMIPTLKQATYTFLLGGVFSKIAENVSTSPKFERNLGKILGTAIPSLITAALTYGVHSLKGTPDPEISTLPTLLISPAGFYYIAHSSRKKLESLLEN